MPNGICDELLPVSSNHLGYFFSKINKWNITETICVLRLFHNYIFTARQRRLGQGNVFTPVCDSVHRVGGICPIACQDTPPGQTPPWQTPPWELPLGRLQTAPPSDTMRYGQQMGGTQHPNKGFHKHTTLAIMPILSSEASLCEKNPVTKCYPQWE